MEARATTATSVPHPSGLPLPHLLKPSPSSNKTSLDHVTTAHSSAPANPPGSTNFICGAAATYCDSSSLCPDYWRGDGYCDAVCNNAECGYDGGQDTGDCAVTDLFANNPCILAGCPSTALMGNGVCDANCNVTACYNDGGDCLTFTAVDCSPGCPISWIGDGICDTACQTPECSDDAGDCTTSGIAAPSAVALYSSCAHASCPSGAPTTLAALVAPMTTQWCIATSARRAFAPLSPLTRSLSCVNSRRSVARTCPWTVHGARRTAAGWHPARER